MKKLCLTISLALSTSASFALNFKSSMQPLKLPLTIGLSLPPTLTDSSPGEMTVGLQRMCGDGDVAHLSSVEPDLQFVAQDLKKLDIITGYWVIDSSIEADPVPTEANFIPVAYIKDQAISDQPSSVAVANTFLPINHALTTGKNGLDLLAGEVMGVYKNAARNFGSTKNYRVYAGVFSCVQLDNDDALVSNKSSDYDYMPGQAEVSNQLSHSGGLAKIAYEAFNSLNKASYTSSKFPESVTYKVGSSNGSLLKFPVESNNAFSPFDIAFHSGSAPKADPKTGNSTLESKTHLISKKIMDLEFPDLLKAPISAPLPDESASEEDKTKFYEENPTTKDKIDFVNAKINEWKLLIPGTIPTSTKYEDKLSYCTSLDMNTKADGPIYRWESFPTNSACRKLFNEEEAGGIDTTTLKDAYDNFFRPVSIASDLDKFSDNFFTLKKSLAMRFFVANAMDMTQKGLQSFNKYKISHAGCFKTDGKPLITRLIASYPLHFTMENGAYIIKPNPNNHIHPEPLFALSNWFEYKESDMLAVWGQVVSQQATYMPSPYSYGDSEYAEYTAPTKVEAEKINPVDWSIYLPAAEKSKFPDYKLEGSSFKGPAINILFRIRSIGGKCPMFC